jgi:signal transduction histidine kinase
MQSRLPSGSPAVPVAVAVAWLPRGRELTSADFAWRHRVVLALLALHLPTLVVVAVLRGQGLTNALPQVVVPLLLLVLATLPVPRRYRGLAASLGLLICSAILVHLFDGVTEAHFHYFVAVAVIALYQDWAVYALAVVFVTLQHAALADADWGVAALHAAFVVAESTVLVVFWHANEQARTREEQLRSALTEGDSSVAARIAETDRIRTDLIGTVSHEFRTPLTGIRGAALTLLKRGERLDADSRARLLHAVLDQQERLSRLLENMLTAASATAPDPSAVAEVDAVAAEVAMLANAAHPGAGAVSVLVTPGTAAQIDRQALHQILANLLDNAQRHGSPGTAPIVAGGQDASGVWITVSNDGSSLDLESATRLFEPFGQLDAGATRDREGLGMGLYVVRRLVEVHGGRVDVRSDDGWVTVEMRLKPAPAVPTGAQIPAPTKLPTA